MTDLLALAERVERLTGPCRETDGLIYRSIDPVIEQCWKFWSPAQLETIVPRYTASLDAAMTLVPEGYFPRIDCRMRMPETIIFDAKGKIAIGTIGAMTATGSLVGAALRLRARAASESSQP